MQQFSFWHKHGWERGRLARLSDQRIVPSAAGMVMIAGLVCLASAGAALDLVPHLGPDRPLWALTPQELMDDVLLPGRFQRGNPSRSTVCRLDEQPVEEALLAWTDEGRLGGIRLVVVSRGDARDLSIPELDRIRAFCEVRIRDWTGISAPVEEERLQQATMSRQRWTLSDRTIVLSWSITRRHLRQATGEVVPERAEFVRIDIMPMATAPSAPNAGGRRGAPGGATRFSENVERQANGDVLIPGVPMVDQGARGYCASATIARMLMYYQMDVDQHDIAQLVNSSPTAGTNADEMMTVLRRSGSNLGITSRRHIDIDYPSIQRMVQQYNQLARRQRQAPIDLSRVADVGQLYQQMDAELLVQSRLRLRAEYNRFLETIRRFVGEGIPIAWTLVVGKVPEEGRIPQSAGGHMRLIIGFNDRTEELIFSDSWGAGHEAKRIRMDHAWAVTTGLYTIEPR